MSIGRHLKAKFFTGLFILTPLLVTVYIIYLVIGSVDAFIAPAMKNISQQITGREIYIPGTGFFLFLIIAYIIGMLASNYIGKKIISSGEHLLRKIPIVKGIYSSVKDMTEAFSSQKKRSFQEVVLTEFPFAGRYALGFVVNRTDIAGLGTFCSVFVPTTPNPTSGYLLLVPEKELLFLDMSVDNALKYIVSIGTARVGLEWTEKRSQPSLQD